MKKSLNRGKTPENTQQDFITDKKTLIHGLNIPVVLLLDPFICRWVVFLFAKFYPFFFAISFVFLVSGLFDFLSL